MIHIDQSTCIGCGLCVSLCPANFRFTDDAKAEPINQDQTAPCVSDAIGGCPVQAISRD